jgi:hypothetical protein
MKVRTVNALVFLVMAACLAFALLYGCASVGVRGEPADLPGLREATALVWQAYGRTDPPPRVRIVQGADLTCTDPVSHNPGFPVLLTSGMGCREGFTISPLEASVAWTGQPWHETALAHELQHVAQGRRGIVDPGHLRIEWSTDVPAANGLLLARGL